MNSTKGWFITKTQCKFSVFQGAKSERFSESLPGGRISWLRSKVISNQTALWKQTQRQQGWVNLRRTSCPEELPVFWRFHYKRTIVFAIRGEKKGMMINHRQNAVEELCCVYSVAFWRPQRVVSVSGGLVATWDASGCFSCASSYSAASNIFSDVRPNASTNRRERRKSEATCVNTLGHMFVRGTL